MIAIHRPLIPHLPYADAPAGVTPATVDAGFVRALQGWAFMGQPVRVEGFPSPEREWLESLSYEAAVTAYYAALDAAKATQ